MSLLAHALCDRLLAASMHFFIGLTMLTTSLEVGRFQIVFALMPGVDDRDLLAIPPPGILHIVVSGNWLRG